MDTYKGKAWSRGTNWRLSFGINMILRLRSHDNGQIFDWKIAQTLRSHGAVQYFLCSHGIKLTNQLASPGWAATYHGTTYHLELNWWLAWENSQHLATLPLLVFPPNDVWETSAEISYWWRLTTQICLVLLLGRVAGNFGSTNQNLLSSFFTKNTC